MAATTAALAAVTFAIPAADSKTDPVAAMVAGSAETVVFDQGQDEMTNDQAISAIYGADEDDR